MSIVQLTRTLHSFASSVALAGAARGKSTPARSLASSGHPSRCAPFHLEHDPSREPLDSLLARCYTAMAQASVLSTSQSLHDLCGMTSAAMKRCLEQQRTVDAVSLYRTVCSSGLLSAVAGEQVYEMDRIAIRALQLLPHQTRNSAILGQLLDAECEGDAEPEPSAVVSSGTPCPSEVESFRITLHQRLRLLRSVDQLRMPLGRNYFLTEARNVLDSPVLRANAEVTPLALVSAGILYHPFTHDQPTAEWARRAAYYDRLDLLTPSAARELSVAQREVLLKVEEGVSPLRPLCHSSLLFLTSVAPDWDEVFHHRVARCLLLPADAHDVFPQAYRAQRRRSRTARQRLAELAAQEVEVDSLRKWTDGYHDLFATASAGGEAGGLPGGVASYQDHLLPLRRALSRAERIMRRRTRRDLVVPDAAYVLSHFHQLQQLAKHREVVLTHGTLLELVRVAVLPGEPRRFHARRALRALMQQTTTAACVGAGQQPMHALRRQRHGSPSSPRHCEGGVTVLGLQDELALLEMCSARADVGVGTESHVDYTERFTEDRSVRHTRVSTVLAAQQLLRMLCSHARGMSFSEAQCSGVRADTNAESVSSLSCDIDDLVDGIVASGSLEAAERPLFKKCRRAFWGNAPVVVATTDESTRVAAYMLGLQTYPPTAST